MRSRLALVDDSSSAEEERTGATRLPLTLAWRPSWNMSSRATCGL
jgi:hypothetical protein